MQLELEKLVAGTIWKTGVWGTDVTLSGTSQWSDATSNPITALDTAMRVVKRNTGSKPDVMFISGTVWDTLKEHPILIEKYKYSQKAILTEDLVSAALGLRKIYVMDSVENTAAEGATYAGADIWTDKALLIKESKMVSKNSPAGAYSFIWQKDGGVPWAMNNYREEQVRADVHRIFTQVDIKVCAKDWGYFFNDVS